MTEASGVRFPLLIINGRNDTSPPTSVIDAYMVRLRTAGKRAETYLPDNGPHGFYFGRPDIPETRERPGARLPSFDPVSGKRRVRDPTTISVWHPTPKSILRERPPVWFLSRSWAKAATRTNRAAFIPAGKTRHRLRI
ncbi:MAG: hypothetical protein HY235_14315 [Acidobacteria bacterium]|nr:hypothetical protein [Acidobacteriota bacterium]